MTKEQWEAIKNNDRSFDGVFFYALKTTKNICKPSCSARSCNPKNVIIFDTYEEAVKQGFRPCLRCRPDQPDWEGARKELAEKARKLLEAHYTEKFSLKTIAGILYVNESYLLRTFKQIQGQTMLSYHNYVRCQAAKELLTRPELSISGISDTVGYCSPSHFTQVFKKTVGCTPSEYRDAYLRALEN